MAKEIEYKLHKVAAMYPRCKPEERDAMEQSIREGGVKNPATLWKDDKGQNWLIDGLTREDIVAGLHKAGFTKTAAGNPIELQYVYFEGTPSEVVEYIEANNMSRRSLSASQRAAVGVKSYRTYIRFLAQEKGVPESEVDPGESGEVAEKIAKRCGSNRAYVYNCLTLYNAPKGMDLLDKVCVEDLKIPKAMAVLKRREAGLTDEPEEENPTEQPVVSNEPDAIYDGLKNEVHPDYRKIFETRANAKKIIKLLKSARAEAEAMVTEPGGKNFNWDQLKTDFKNIIRHAEDHQPFAVCPMCSGTGKDTDGKKCKHCAGRKYLDRQQWKLLPPEIRQQFETKASAAAGDDDGE